MTYHSFLEIKLFGNKIENQFKTLGNNKKGFQTFIGDSKINSYQSSWFLSDLSRLAKIENLGCFNYIFFFLGFIFKRSTKENDKKTTIQFLTHICPRYLSSKSTELVFSIFLRLKKKQHLVTDNTSNLSNIINIINESKGKTISMSAINEKEKLNYSTSTSIEVFLEILRNYIDVFDFARANILINKMHFSLLTDQVDIFSQVCFIENVVQRLLEIGNFKDVSYLFAFRIELLSDKEENFSSERANILCSLFFFTKFGNWKKEKWFFQLVKTKFKTAFKTHSKLFVNLEKDHSLIKWTNQKKIIWGMRIELFSIFGKYVSEFLWSFRKIIIEQTIHKYIKIMKISEARYLQKLLQLDFKDLEHWLHYYSRKYTTKIKIDQKLGILYV